jgi:drug/metabolite transporter (DMT)-like permease
MKTPRRQAVIYLVLAAVLWSSSGLLIKVITWQPLSILAGRSIIAAVIYLIYLRHLRLRRNIHFRWSPTLAVGAVAFLGTQALFITATKMTTAANAIFLQYTAPVYVVILSYGWLGERPERADWAAMAVILTGLLFFFGDRLSFEGITGNVLAILSGVAMAVMMVSMRRIGRGASGIRSRGSGPPLKTSPAYVTLIGYGLGALVGLPSLVQESFTPQNLGIIAFLGLFQIGLAFILYAAAIQHVQALEATLILTLEPILNPIWVFLIIGEMPGPMALLGSALVVTAVAIRAVISARADQPIPRRKTLRSEATGD